MHKCISTCCGFNTVLSSRRFLCMFLLAIEENHFLEYIRKPNKVTALKIAELKVSTKKKDNKEIINERNEGEKKEIND